MLAHSLIDVRRASAAVSPHIPTSCTNAANVSFTGYACRITTDPCCARTSFCEHGNSTSRIGMRFLATSVHEQGRTMESRTPARGQDARDLMEVYLSGRAQTPPSLWGTYAEDGRRDTAQPRISVSPDSEFGASRVSRPATLRSVNRDAHTYTHPSSRATHYIRCRPSPPRP